MHRKNRLRACGLGLVLAVVAAAAGPAYGSSIAVSGFVSTASVDHRDSFEDFIFEDWQETKYINAADDVTQESIHADMIARASAVVLEGPFWFGVSANVVGVASQEYQGAEANANIHLQVTDQITPRLQVGYAPNHTYRYTQHFHIDGFIAGAAAYPGYFVSQASVDIRHNNQTVYYDSEAMDAAGNSAGPMRKGDVTFELDALPGVPYDFSIRAFAFAFGTGVDNAGNYFAESYFQHTFRWGEVTDVFDVTAGVPIPAEAFHLDGADGFDWAHPPAVPEPSVLGLIVLAGASLLFRRPVRHL